MIGDLRFVGLELFRAAAEVAHLLNLSLGSTYTLIRQGEIPALKMGGRLIVPKKRFHAWLDSCVEEPDPHPPYDTWPGGA